MRDSRAIKLVRDIMVEGSRSFLVALAISVGVFAFASVLDARSILVRELDANYSGTLPAAAVIELRRGFADSASATEILKKISGVVGVRDASLSGELSARVRRTDGEWRAMRLFTLPDYRHQVADLVSPASGNWPPRDGEILVERAAAPMLDAKAGDELQVSFGEGIARDVRDAGTVHAPGLAPAWMERIAYGWVSAGTLASWGVSNGLNRVSIHVSGNPLDKKYIGEVAGGVRAVLENNGIPVSHVAIPEPGHHPHASQMLTLLYLLETFGILAMALASVLTATMIASLMSRQVRQIGIMKAVGGTARQIRMMYCAKIAIFAVVACLVAIPLANRAAVAYAKFAAATLNFTIFDDSVPLAVYVFEVAASLAVPLLVSLFSIVRGSRISVREAIADSGSAGVSSVAARVPGNGGGIPVPLRMSLRNAVRRPGRLALSLATLAAAGAMFITAMNVGSSMNSTVESKFRAAKYDVRLMLSRAVPDSELSDITASVQGIDMAETWGYNPAYALSGEGTESERLDLISIPPSTVLQGQPPLVEGRWIAPTEADAIVVNQRVLPSLGGAKVGDRIMLLVDGHRTSWRLIGIVRELMATPTCYANKPAVDSLLGLTGLSKIIVVRGTEHDRAFVDSLGDRVERALALRGVSVASSTALLELRQAIEAHFAVIASMLVLMALLVIIVGALGLSSAMGINVLERTRELGILGAIGAGRRAVILSVVIEGALIGAVSWLLSAIASLPVSAFVANRFGLLFFEAPLEFSASPSGIFLWLAIVLGCAIAASYVPAAGTTSVPIRETLAWE